VLAPARSPTAQRIPLPAGFNLTGYTLELLGWPDDPATAYPGRVWHFYDPDVDPPINYHLQIWHQQSFLTAAPRVYAELVSLPGDYRRTPDGRPTMREHAAVRWEGLVIPEGEESVRYEHPRPTVAEYQAALEGLRRLQHAGPRVLLTPRRGGRKRGTKKYEPSKTGAREDLLHDLERAIWQLLDRDGPDADISIKSVAPFIPLDRARSTIVWAAMRFS
jgi:hypothetical protein